MLLKQFDYLAHLFEDPKRLIDVKKEELSEIDVKREELSENEVKREANSEIDPEK